MATVERRPGRRWALAVAAASVVACLSPPVTVLAVGEPGPTRDDSNEIELWADGKKVATWTVEELMEGRFDWKSPKGQVYPAVPLTFTVAPRGEAARLEAITRLAVVGQETLILEGDALSLIPGLLLKLDVARGGTWQLVGRDEETDRRLDELAEGRRQRKIHRIEVARE